MVYIGPICLTGREQYFISIDTKNMYSETLECFEITNKIFSLLAGNSIVESRWSVNVINTFDMNWFKRTKKSDVGQSKPKKTFLDKPWREYQEPWTTEVFIPFYLL